MLPLDPSVVKIPQDLTFQLALFKIISSRAIDMKEMYTAKTPAMQSEAFPQPLRK
jgi:hypothetical protein